MPKLKCEFRIIVRLTLLYSNIAKKYILVLVAQLFYVGRRVKREKLPL